MNVLHSPGLSNSFIWLGEWLWQQEKQIPPALCVSRLCFDTHVIELTLGQAQSPQSHDSSSFQLSLRHLGVSFEDVVLCLCFFEASMQPVEWQGPECRALVENAGHRPRHIAGLTMLLKPHRASLWTSQAKSMGLRACLQTKPVHLPVYWHVFPHAQPLPREPHKRCWPASH